MSDFEERLSQMLAERADASPAAVGLAEGARARHRRRRALKVGAAGAAVVAAIAAVPLGLGALSIDEGADVANQPEPVVSGVPAGWRFESYRNVEFAVPPDWGYGSLEDWCASGGNLDKPRVERPGGSVLDILCPSSAYGVRLGQAPDNPPAGAVVRSATAGGVTLSVVAPDQEIAETVAGSLREIQGTDYYGCDPRKEVPALGEMTGSGNFGQNDPVALCRYEIGVEGANLLSSEGVSEPADLRSLWLGLNSAEPGTGPDSGPDTCIDWPEGQALLLLSDGKELGWVHYDGCAGHGIDLRGTTYELNAQVMYWAMPRGGSSFDGSVPLPKELRP